MDFNQFNSNFMRITIILSLFFLFSGLHAQTSDQLFKEGEALIKAQKFEEATKKLGEIIQKDSLYLNASIKRAYVYILLNDYEHAISDYNRVLRSRPDDVFMLQSRGSAQNKLGHYEEAKADFNRVIELDPKNAEAYQNRGWSYKLSGDMDNACKDWNKSKKLGNEEAKIILSNNKCR